MSRIWYRFATVKMNLYSIIPFDKKNIWVLRAIFNEDQVEKLFILYEQEVDAELLT